MNLILIIVFQSGKEADKILDNLLLKLILKTKFFNSNRKMLVKVQLEEQLFFMKKEKEKLLVTKEDVLNEKVLLIALNHYLHIFRKICKMFYSIIKKLKVVLMTLISKIHKKLRSFSFIEQNQD